MTGQQILGGQNNPIMFCIEMGPRPLEPNWITYTRLMTGLTIPRVDRPLRAGSTVPFLERESRLAHQRSEKKNRSPTAGRVFDMSMFYSRSVCWGSRLMISSDCQCNTRRNRTHCSNEKGGVKHTGCRKE